MSATLLDEPSKLLREHGAYRSVCSTADVFELNAGDQTPSSREPESVREIHSSPSTPMFVPAPRFDSVNKIAIFPTALSDIPEPTSSEYERVITLKDFKLRCESNSGISLEAIVTNKLEGSRETRIIAEGTDIVHDFTRALGEEVFGLSSKVSLEEVQMSVSRNGDKSYYKVTVSVKKLSFRCLSESFSKGSAEDNSNALTASLRAVCVAIARLSIDTNFRECIQNYSSEQHMSTVGSLPTKAKKNMKPWLKRLFCN